MSYGEVAKVARPKFGLWGKRTGSARGSMERHRAEYCETTRCPEIATLRLVRLSGQKDSSRSGGSSDVRQLLKEREDAAKDPRDEEGRTVMGMKRLREKHFRDVPSSRELFFDSEPWVSGSAPETRRAEARELRAFRSTYQHALAIFKEGGRVDFPMGTSWLQRVLGVECSFCPS